MLWYEKENCPSKTFSSVPISDHLRLTPWKKSVHWMISSKHKWWEANHFLIVPVENRDAYLLLCERWLQSVILIITNICLEKQQELQEMNKLSKSTKTEKIPKIMMAWRTSQRKYFKTQPVVFKDTRPKVCEPFNNAPICHCFMVPKPWALSCCHGNLCSSGTTSQTV